MSATPPPPGPPPAPSGWGSYEGAPPPPAPAAPVGGPAAPGGVAPGGLPHTSGLAIGALICAIGSFFVCPVIGAVVAIALAYNASNHIADSGGSIRGSGMATAAKVLGWIHLALAILLVLAIDLALLNV